MASSPSSASTNDGLNLAVNLLVLFLVVDLAGAGLLDLRATRAAGSTTRCWSRCATAASLFPFIGTIVYLIVRPPEFLDDVRERELEMHGRRGAARAARLPALPALRLRGRADYLRCPSCMRKLKEPCAVCGKPLDPRWRICPYCEAEIGRRRRRPRPRRAPARPDRRPADGREPTAAPPDATSEASHAAASRPQPARGRSRPNRKEPAMDRTLILVKPDAFARGLTGEIIARFERKGLRSSPLKHMTVDRRSRRAALRRARRASRSSASSSSSSPAARSSRWCSRATRP